MKHVCIFDITQASEHFVIFNEHVAKIKFYAMRFKIKNTEYSRTLHACAINLHFCITFEISV